jgi:hypothetical protein
LSKQHVRKQAKKVKRPTQETIRQDSEDVQHRKKKHFKKVTKLTSDLTETASRFHLEILRPDANPRTRRDTFLAFKCAVEDALAQHSDTAEIMQQHSIIPASVQSYVNEGLAAFLNAHMLLSVKNLTSSGLLKQLQTMNASAMPADPNQKLITFNVAINPIIQDIEACRPEETATTAQLFYANDGAIADDDPKKVQRLTDNYTEIVLRVDMKMNDKKTKVMAVDAVK